jgi:transmembrane sensor
MGVTLEAESARPIRLGNEMFDGRGRGDQDMTDLSPDKAAELRREAFDWLRRLSSGEATMADADALERWRARSRAHAAEFAKAALLWDVLGDAARKAESGRAAAVSPPDQNDRRLARRGFLIGGAALAASVAGMFVLRPPLELWPSAAELAADFRTQPGERRKIEVAIDAAVELNTRTSLDLRPSVGNEARIELISGEAAVSTRVGADQALVVVAGAGRATARNSSFDIRKDGPSVSVSCIAGTVDVSCEERNVSIRAGQQVTYDARGTREVVAFDPDAITAWQRGLLIFRRVPLSDVVDEVNRYRAGRIILLDRAMRQRLVVATFRIDRIDDVVDFISRAMNIPIRSLPGGVVLAG